MGLATVYDQQIRYHRSRGDTYCTRMLFREELVQEIKILKQKDKSIVVMMDTTKYPNKGKL